MAYKYANLDAKVIEDGKVFVLRRGEVWHADAEIVGLRPDLFDDEPLMVRGVPVVEQATKEPGQVRRGPGRPRKS